MWQLEHNIARLDTRELSAKVDILRPGDGIHDIVVWHFKLPGTRLLRVLSPLHERNHEQVFESYARGRDLIATYSPTPDCPVRPQIYWRVCDFQTKSGDCAGWELIVSTQTGLLDSDASVTVATDLDVDEVWRLKNIDRGEFEQIEERDPAGQQIEPSNGASVVLFRTTEPELSYVEIVHPAEFQDGKLFGNTTRDTRVTWNRKLFGNERLEKGVIRRSRMWGFFVPRQHDLQTAFDRWQELQRTSPPLTT